MNAPELRKTGTLDNPLRWQDRPRRRGESEAQRIARHCQVLRDERVYFGGMDQM